MKENKDKNVGTITFRKLKIMFAGYEDSEPKSIQQFIVSKLLYKTYKYMQDLKRIQLKFRQMGQDSKIRQEIRQNKNKIRMIEGGMDCIKNIGIIDYQNLEGQIQNSQGYDRQINEKINRIVKWVDAYIDIANSFQTKHFQKVSQIKFALQNLAYVDQYVQGLEEDLQQTENLVKQIFNKTCQDVEMLNITIEEAKNGYHEMMKQITEINTDQK